jgi:hypothetical protein
MAIPGDPATNFVEILERLWWKLDRALTAEDVRYSTLLFLVDAIRHGTTTLIDHHASPNAIEGSLDVIADAVKQAGLRASLCYEVTDRNGKDGAVAGIEENVRFIKRCQREKDPQLGASFGLHAALTLSDETLEAVAIGRMERFVGDTAIKEGWINIPYIEPTPFRIGIVGSGPAGMACAADMAKAGCDVTVYEAFHEPGGVLKYGIPDFRLPNTVIDAEIDKLRQLGVKFECNTLVGRLFTLEQMVDEMGYNAVFVGVGAGYPTIPAGRRSWPARRRALPVRALSLRRVFSMQPSGAPSRAG